MLQSNGSRHSAIGRATTLVCVHIAFILVVGVAITGVANGQVTRQHGGGTSWQPTPRPHQPHASGRVRTASSVSQPSRTTVRRPPSRSSAVRSAAAGEALVSMNEGTPVHSVLESPSALESYAGEPVYYDEGTAGYAHDDCLTCGTVAGCCCLPTGYLLDWSRADLWSGVNAFTGPGGFPGSAPGVSASPSQAQVGGAFGFHQGFNFGSRLPSLLGGQIGSQLGMRFTQTQLDGTQAGHDTRTQAFITAGLFRRVDYGVQGGLVVDYLHDDWVYKADLLQLRGEISFLFSPCHDFGFRFTDSQQIDDTQAMVSALSVPLDVRLTALNTYRFFYRYRYGPQARGLAEVQAGFSEESSAILGLTLKTPLHNQLGIETTATYLLPSDESMLPYVEESWNISMAVVWTPGRVFGGGRDYYRPLLDVADNGSLLTKLLAN